MKISRHLTVLRSAGLVNDRRVGLWVYYSLVEPRNELEKCIFDTLKQYLKKNDFFKKDIKNIIKCTKNKKDKGDYNI